MKYTLSKEFTFDAAHNLVHYQGKCENLHGHTYRLRVEVSGKPGNPDGMLIDFGILKELVGNLVINRLDHQYLNDIVPQSTAEHLIAWIWNVLEAPVSEKGVTLETLTLWETATSFVTLSRD